GTAIRFLGALSRHRVLVNAMNARPRESPWASYVRPLPEGKFSYSLTDDKVRPEAVGNPFTIGAADKSGASATIIGTPGKPIPAPDRKVPAGGESKPAPPTPGVEKPKETRPADKGKPTEPPATEQSNMPAILDFVDGLGQHRPWRPRDPRLGDLK